MNEIIKHLNEAMTGLAIEQKYEEAKIVKDLIEDLAPKKENFNNNNGQINIAKGNSVVNATMDAVKWVNNFREDK